MRPAILAITIIALMFLHLTPIASADPVPWSYEEYWTYTESGIDNFSGYTDYDSDSAIVYDDSGLPIFSSSLVKKTTGIYMEGEADTTIAPGTSSLVTFAENQTINVNSYAYGFAKNEFYGEFTATNQLLEFTYDISYSWNIQGYNPSSHVENFFGAGLTVYDVTDGVALYDSWRYVDTIFGDGVGSWDESGSDSGTLYLPITIGHDIQITAGAWLRDIAKSNSAAGGSLYYNYTVAVTPEPISSILFLTGGATLALKSYRKRRKSS